MESIPTLGGRRIVTVRLSDLSEQAFSRFYRELLEPVFPADELMTYGDMESARHGDDTDGVVLLDQDTVVAGMVTEDYLGGRVRLLGYLVVAAHARCNGLGAHLLATLSRSSGDALVLAEIEDPRFHRPDRGNAPSARLRFYARHGWRLLPLDYVQPSLRPGSPRVDHLLLIALSPKSPGVDGRLVADFLEESYLACEGRDVVEGDPAFLAMRQAAEGDVAGRLRLVSLEDLPAARPGPSGEPG